MNNTSKNKLLTWLVVLLLLANAITITLFWMGKARHPQQPNGTPQEFLVQQLKLDSKQQEQLQVLVKEHQQSAALLRKKIRESKEAFFDLLHQPVITDSVKQAAANTASKNTEALDLLTFNHFKKIRLLCTAEQQKKFDQIIREVTNMIIQPRPPGRPGNNTQGPPPEGPGGDRQLPPGAPGDDKPPHPPN